MKNITQSYLAKDCRGTILILSDNFSFKKLLLCIEALSMKNTIDLLLFSKFLFFIRLQMNPTKSLLLTEPSKT
jgi:hypothetical protein